MTMGDPAGHGTSGTVEQVKETAGQLVDQAREQAKPTLQSQKERAAGGLGTTAGALRQTSQQLRGQDQEMVAQYVDQAAERVERFAGYLRRRDLDGLVADAERFARRQPGLFLGGAFALGLLGARFLKSSSDRANTAARRQTARSGGPGPAAYRNPSMSGSPRGAGFGDWAAGRASGAGFDAAASARSEPAWTSRDDRASAGLSETRGATVGGRELNETESSASGIRTGSMLAPDEAIR